MKSQVNNILNQLIGLNFFKKLVYEEIDKQNDSQFILNIIEILNFIITTNPSSIFDLAPMKDRIELIKMKLSDEKLNEFTDLPINSIGGFNSF